MQHKPISQKPVKNDGGTILNGGNTVHAENNVLNLSQLTTYVNHRSSVVEAVSAAESGNIGTFKPLTGGVFNGDQAGNYIGYFITNKIAGVDSDTLKNPARPRVLILPYGHGNHRYNITGWDYVTGKATKGVNAGDLFTYWGPQSGSTVSMEAVPTFTVPGEFTYLANGQTPVMADYKPRTLA